MPVEFNNVGGSKTCFQDNAQPVKLNDGRTVQADALQNGDVFLIRRGEWETIDSVPVVT